MSGLRAQRKEAAKQSSAGKWVRFNGFQIVALITIAATYGLIGLGGLVRASGSGLGCPDWPKCFDRWIPPLRVADIPSSIDPALFNLAKAWTEYLNRLAGVAVGFLMAATLVMALIQYRRTRSVVYPSVLAFILVGVEGWVGGQVVLSGLTPWILTVHLTFALLIASLLLFAVFSTFSNRTRRLDRTLVSDARRLTVGCVIVSLVVLAQVGLGAQVRGEVQLLTNHGTEAVLGPAWFIPLSAVFDLHRLGAALVTLGLLGLMGFALKRPGLYREVRFLLGLVAGLVALEVIVGLGLVRFHLPPILKVAHLWLGSALLGTLTILGLFAYRLGASSPESSPKVEDSVQGVSHGTVRSFG